MTDCVHPDFAAVVDVNRLTKVDGGPVTAYTADVRIRCAVCDLAFQFVGPPVGLLADGLAVSVDGTELRIPLRPAGEPRTGIDMPSYRVRQMGRTDA